ncbi:MAG: DUF1003 domain-containing protein [Acidobacteriota bacterium]|nr:DUF1003 domain-containing protein [Blastocatellia bacterium]MDW8238217.1 DUF1003 domain-containing protein [Acidobacteriota bacterium]
MSQSRQAERDRLEAHHGYVINQKAEEEIRAILDHLAAQDQAFLQIHQMLIDQQLVQVGKGTLDSSPMPGPIEPVYTNGV